MEETSMDNVVTRVQSPSPCVQVKNAYKSFSFKGHVLKKLNMTVPQGSIYSLLGPSGCGKTTLLGSLVGRIKLDSGEISMSVRKKSDIGYMPQEIALYQEFNIREHMMYYGYLFSMETRKIIKRTRELLKFLQLGDMECIISHLSGGQQRRVSLCIALLHDPQLLILDEPTVGVDIVLSHSIWENLHEMTLSGKTIIITTHYIEEAKRSNMIGLMRNGSILAEDEPNHLLEVHNCETLEEVFLKLCRKDCAGNDHGDFDAIEAIDREKTNQTWGFTKERALNRNRIFAYIIKNMYWMKRNIPMMLFTLGLPILQCTLISLTVGDDPNGLYIGVVNDELVRGSCSNQHQFSCNSDFMLSCLYVNKLKEKGLNIIEYNNTDQGLAAAKRNYVWGIVHINANYSSAILRRLNDYRLLTDDVLDQSEINVWLDLSSQVIGSVIKKHLTNSVVEFIESVCKICNYSTANADIPLMIENPVFGIKEASFRQFMTPANAVLFVFYLPMIFTLGAMLMEKTSGLLERSLVAGISLFEIGVGHIALQFFILSIQTIFMMLVLFWIFDNPIEGSLVSCVALLLLVGMCGMFYGFFVAAICTSFTTASCLAIGSYFPLFMLSGAIWPLEGMHYILRYMSAVLPITTSVESFRALSVRNWPLTHPKVYGSIISLIAWSIILCIATIWSMRKKGLS